VGGGLVLSHAAEVAETLETSQHAADVITANRSDLMESSVSRNADSRERRAAPQEGQRNASEGFGDSAIAGHVSVPSGRP
jgi:hypothetical protein